MQAFDFIYLTYLNLISSFKEAVMTSADFRRLALSMPEAVESSHFGVADFRVNKKIFATLAFEKEGYGVLLLTPDQQAGMVEDEPEIFSPVPGGWGKTWVYPSSTRQGRSRHPGRCVANRMAQKRRQSVSWIKIKTLVVSRHSSVVARRYSV